MVVVSESFSHVQGLPCHFYVPLGHPFSSGCLVRSSHSQQDIHENLLLHSLRLSILAVGLPHAVPRAKVVFVSALVIQWFADREKS